MKKRCSYYGGWISCVIAIATISLANGATQPVATSPVPAQAIAPKATGVTPASANVTAEFQAFWNRFRNATLNNDLMSIMTMTRFPFSTQGQEDKSPVVKHSKSAFPQIWRQALVQDYATVPAYSNPLEQPTAHHQTLREYIAHTSLVLPQDVTGNNWARVGDLQFEKIAGHWQLTAVYTNTAK